MRIVALLPLLLFSVACSDPCTGPLGLDTPCKKVSSLEQPDLDSSVGVDSGAGDGDAGQPPTGCEQDEQCTDPAQPRCVNRACTTCTNSTECGRFMDTPVCGTDGACTVCRDGEPGACALSLQVCRAGGNDCVGCNTDDDCGDPGAAKCDTTTNECVQCDGNAQCDHISVSGNDGFDLCVDGSCVECTVADESACGPNSCDPATGRCTATARASRDVCQTCVADSECAAGHRCVETLYQGTSQGGRCLRLDDDACPLPYGAQITRASLSAPELVQDYCGFDENVTSCAAILALVNAGMCPSEMDAECPQPGGLCKKVGTQNNRCTYACGNDDDCPGSRPCGGSEMGMPSYCGG